MVSSNIKYAEESVHMRNILFYRFKSPRWLYLTFFLLRDECSENEGDDFYYKISNEITRKIKVKKYFYSGEEYEPY